jgi:hypothetical protein
MLGSGKKVNRMGRENSLFRTLMYMTGAGRMAKCTGLGLMSRMGQESRGYGNTGT